MSLRKGTDFETTARRIAATLTLAAALMLAGAAGEPAGAQATAAKQPASSSTKAPPLRGQKLADATCAACHGPRGNTTSDPQYPKIAGQTYYYLLQQLHAFKSGARKSDIMAPVVSGLSDGQLADLARLYSRQSIKPDAVKNRRLAELGARIFNYPNRGAPPCAACHAAEGYGGMMGRGGMMGHMAMMGGSAGVPRLSGQHAGYTVQQLDAFAEGKRRGTVMGPIAARLPEQYRRAVAEYLSGLR